MATGWVSHVSGPIASHRIYECDNDNDNFYDNKSQGKTNKLKNEATRLNLCGKGYLGSFSNRTVSPKDHMLENVKRMREIHRASRQRQEENKQNRCPIKLNRRPDSCASANERKSEYQVQDSSNNIYNKSFENNKPSTTSHNNTSHMRAQSASPSIVTKLQIGNLNESLSPSLNSSNKTYLRAHEKTGPPMELSSYPLTPIRREASNIKISVPKASTAREVNLIRRDIDFVRANAYAAKSARLKRSPSVDSLLMNHNTENDKKQRKPGEIPNYLLKRRNQWKEQEQLYLLNQPDPDQPPGHRKMCEKERLATLELLKASEKDMLTELGRLPIRTDTLKLRTKKQEIEQKLNELEEAIKIFSKPKVFVRCDN